MDFSQYGFFGPEAQAPNAEHSGCACSKTPGHDSPGPTPSPFPPSPMMPGPSMQFQGNMGFPGASATPYSTIDHSGMKVGEAGSHQTGASSASHAHPGTFQQQFPTHPMNHPPLHESYHYGYYPYGTPVQNVEPASEGYPIFGLNLSDGSFWKGALIGTALTLLITNETVQKSIIKGVVNAYSGAQDGLSELKEMFEDTQAEFKKPSE